MGWYLAWGIWSKRLLEGKKCYIAILHRLIRCTSWPPLPIILLPCLRHQRPRVWGRFLRIYGGLLGWILWFETPWYRLTVINPERGLITRCLEDRLITKSGHYQYSIRWFAICFMFIESDLLACFEKIVKLTSVKMEIYEFPRINDLIWILCSSNFRVIFVSIGEKPG